MKFDRIIDHELIGDNKSLIEDLTPLEKVEFIKYLWAFKNKGFDGIDECFNKVIELI